MKNIIVFVGFVLVMMSCKNEPKNINPTIFTGEIKGAKTGKLYLFQTKDTVIRILDSVVFDGNGKFNFGLSFEEPEVVYLGFDKGITQSPDNNLMVFLNPGITNLETTVEKFYADAKVTGSKNHELWDNYKKIMSRYTDQNLNLIELRFKAIRNKNQKSADSIENLQKNLNRRKYLQTLNFALVNKDFEIAPFLLLSEIPDVNPKLLDSINDNLNQKIKNSKYGKLLQTHINKNLLDTISSEKAQ